MISLRKLYTFDIVANPSFSGATISKHMAMEELRLEKIKERFNKIDKIRARIKYDK